MSSQLSLSLSPLSLQQDDRTTQDHSNEGQPCQAQSPGPHPFKFPLRIIPPGYEKHPGPRPPLEAYQEAQHWIEWHREPSGAGLWNSAWLQEPMFDDVSLLVEEMVLHGILPECFSVDDGDQEAARARIEPFNSGMHNQLYTLRCRCCLTSQEEQAAVAGSSPQDLSQSSSRIKSQRPLNNSSPLIPSGCRSTLLHHDGGSDKQDICNGSHIPGEVLLRLSLPLDPYFHMESDVATTHFARVRGVPVPRIYAYDSSAINCLSIEWQLVEKIPEQDVNFVHTIISQEENVLRARGRPPAGIDVGQSSAWTRLGRRLEETLNLLRSEGHNSYGGQSSGVCFDKIGSLYWDFEKHDFVLGPVSDHFFTSGRRILYHQRHDGDGGDPRLPLLRGPFHSVSECLNAILTIWLRESNDEALRVDDDRLHPWYTKADAEAAHDQVSKLRDIIIPWLVAKLTSKQQERMRTYIFHPDLHSSNLLVSRRAQAQTEGDGARINVLGEEYSISAILDWEHAVALPDYLIHPVNVATSFCSALPTTECPDFSCATYVEKCLGDTPDGGRTARSPWTATVEIPAESVPEGLVPWRSGDNSGHDPAPAEGAGSGGSNVGGVRGADSDMQQREASMSGLMAPPRKLTNAEVLLRFIFEELDTSVGWWSESWVNPLVETIQAHIAYEGEN